MAGVGNAFENSCILTGVGVAAILICVAIMPRYGRRRVFLVTSLIICGFCQLIVAVCYTKRDPTQIQQTGRIIVAFSIIYIVAYNGGMASFAWVVGGELPRQALRSYTFGLAAFVGFIGAWLAAFTAPYFINPASLGWGPQYGYIWLPSCLIAAAFVFFFIPEVGKPSTISAILTNDVYRLRIVLSKKSTRCSKLMYLHANSEAIGAPFMILLRRSLRWIAYRLRIPSRGRLLVSRSLMLRSRLWNMLRL
jgi:hypothetical protein